MNDERGTMNGPEGSSFIGHRSSFQTNEGLRKFLHIIFGLFAVGLKYLPWRVAALFAAGAVLLNWLVLHRLVGRSVARHERGYDNVVVPATAAGMLAVFAIQPLVPFIVTPPIRWPWLALNTVLAILGYIARSVDLSGLIVGWFIGCVVIIGGGPPLYVALLVFFI